METAIETTRKHYTIFPRRNGNSQRPVVKITIERKISIIDEIKKSARRWLKATPKENFTDWLEKLKGCV